MKRTMTIAEISALVLLMLFALSGCGSSQEKADEAATGLTADEPAGLSGEQRVCRASKRVCRASQRVCRASQRVCRASQRAKTLTMPSHPLTQMKYLCLWMRCRDIGST